MFLLESFYFFVLVVLVFYLPGKFLLRILKSNPEDKVLSFGLSIGTGVALFLLATYLLSFIHIEFLYNILILPLILAEGRRLILGKKYKWPVTKANSTEVFLISLGTIAMSYLTVKSGTFDSQGMLFYASNARDGIYHLALSGNLLHNFPPTHPELAEVPLRGYHFFYDFLVASFSKFYHLNTADLFFRYFSVFTALLYGVSAWALARNLKMSKLSTNVFLFLIYFGSGIEFILKPFLKDAVYNPGMNPLLVNIINPSVLLSISLLFFFYTLTFKKNRSNILLPALLLGIMPQVKIYTAVLAFAGLAAVGLFSYLKNKDLYFIKILIISGLISAVVFIPFNFGSGGLIFTPLLLYRHFMETLSFKWGSQMQVFEVHNNLPRMGILYIEGVLLFFLPTLGIRILSIAMLPRLRHKSFYQTQNLFWIVMGITGVILSSFFIQTIDVFNSVQFLWVVYILLLIPTAFSLQYIFPVFLRKFPFAKFAVILFVIMLSIPANIDVLKLYSKELYIVKNDKVEIGRYIAAKVPQADGVLVVNVYNNLNSYDLPEVAAISAHPTFYESTITSFKDSEQIEQDRIKEVNKIDPLLKNCVGDVNNILGDIMLRTNNRYILTLKNYGCFSNLKDFKLVVNTAESSLYKLINYGKY